MARPFWAIWGVLCVGALLWACSGRETKEEPASAPPPQTGAASSPESAAPPAPPPPTEEEIIKRKCEETATTFSDWMKSEPLVAPEKCTRCEAIRTAMKAPDATKELLAVGAEIFSQCPDALDIILRASEKPTRDERKAWLADKLPSAMMTCTCQTGSVEDLQALVVALLDVCTPVVNAFVAWTREVAEGRGRFEREDLTVAVIGGENPEPKLVEMGSTALKNCEAAKGAFLAAAGRPEGERLGALADALDLPLRACPCADIDFTGLKASVWGFAMLKAKHEKIAACEAQSGGVGEWLEIRAGVREGDPGVQTNKLEESFKSIVALRERKGKKPKVAAADLKKAKEEEDGLLTTVFGPCPAARSLYVKFMKGKNLLGLAEELPPALSACECVVDTDSVKELVAFHGPKPVQFSPAAKTKYEKARQKKALDLQKAKQKKDLELQKAKEKKEREFKKAQEKKEKQERAKQMKKGTPPSGKGGPAKEAPPEEAKKADPAAAPAPGGAEPTP